VLFNARPETTTFTDNALAGMPFELHPVLAASSDPVVKESTFEIQSDTFSIPALTTAVFVVKADQ
jgi:pullulanase